MRRHFLLYINNSTTNEISKIFLTVVHIVIHNGGNNSDIHRSLKYCFQNFKTCLKNIKYKINIFYPTVLDNLILLKRYTYVQ